MSIQEQLNKDVLRNFKKKFKVLIENGLKVRGYRFKTNEELRYFIQTRCRAVRKENEVIYYVDGMPFLIFWENVQLDFNTENGGTFIMEYGEYKFIKR